MMKSSHNPYVELRTERLVLSVPTARDIPNITRYCQDPLFERFMTTPWPYTEGDAAYFVQNIVPTVWSSGVEFTWAIRIAPTTDMGAADAAVPTGPDGAADAADAADPGSTTPRDAAPGTAGPATAPLGTAAPAATAPRAEPADAADLPLAGMIGWRVPSSGLGFWIGEDHRGKGYMTEAVNAVAEWVFARGTTTIKWECVVGNVASASVARKAGFRFTGTRASPLDFRDGSHPLAWHGELGAPSLRADLSPVPELPWPPESFAR